MTSDERRRLAPKRDASSVNDGLANLRVPIAIKNQLKLMAGYERRTLRRLTIEILEQHMRRYEASTGVTLTPNESAAVRGRRPATRG
jgi:hypothetical protein